MVPKDSNKEFVSLIKNKMNEFDNELIVYGYTLMVGYLYVVG